ncbi:ABC transporter ATP-binding protein [Thioflexithrix psekupsensis]|uniref:ABC transporter n=1 Tax=Thioflexithrix psekupsensis TaxID=1570016 RepID=A0A251X7K2_9GAMM|nr:ABC transporter ATP-binding protein [Thioflexithrix psekupsensis]OUD13169.1 ABC transporter [Thioflexithrix psekupsensis]
MSTQEKVVSLKNVGVFYKKNRGIFGEPFWALRDVSFELYQGETLGIIGRNGVGKSTLLRLIAGIIKPDCGEITNYGYQVSLLSLQLGFIPYLTGRENAVLSGMLLGLRRKEVIEKLPAIIEFSELGAFIEQPISTYSSGMVARLGFSVAFMVDPDVLLIDEVLGVGDAEFSAKSTRVMQEKIKSNKTIIFVSHNAVLVNQLCDRVVWIEEGVSRCEGETAKVLAEYHKFLSLK